MAELPRIRTPWKQQWRRIRYQLFPVLTAGLAALGAVWLWTRHSGTADTVGEVQAVQTVAASPVGGLLVQIPYKQIALYDEVRENEVVAQLDDRPTLAALRTLNAELARLRLELPAREEEMRLEQARLGHDHQTEARRLAVQIEELRLRILDRRTQLEADRIELQRHESILENLRELAERDLASRREMLDVELRHDVVQQRIAGGELALKEAETQLEAAHARAGALESPLAPFMENVLAPLSAAITVHEARLAELDLQLRSLAILSPMTGRVIAIHRVPGQAVQPGEPIVTISNEQGRFIVSYVRDDQRARPAVGDIVYVRQRMAGVRYVASTIYRVGPAVEPVPQHQLRDPQRPEWGYPVLISVPIAPEMPDLRPGELLDVKIGGTNGG